jgi:hypothetical protein
MSKQCRLMPEIHPQVMKLIADVYNCHTAGQGILQMTELISLFGADIEKSDLNKIGARGPITLIKTSANGGTFKNEGSAFEFKSNGITLKVPSLIEGNYISFADNLSLAFSDSYTLVGSVFVFSAKVKDIDANQSRIDIDVSGDSFDQCIIHAAA